MTPSPIIEIRRHVGGFTSTNGYAVRTDAGWTGVDAPEGFSDWLKAQGIRLESLLLTHAHFDHVQDAAEIARTHQCKVFAWEISTPESRLENWVQQMAGMRLEVEDYPVDTLLEGKSEVEAGGVSWQLFHVPGHSPDSVVFYNRESAQLFSGDTLMEGTMGRADFPGGSTSLLITGIKEKLLPLGDEIAVHPGHGESTTLGAEKGWVQRF